jgi:hypothetical protein
MKICRKCRELKDPMFFNFSSSSKDKMSRICKECKSVEARASYLKNRKHILEYQQNYKVKCKRKKLCKFCKKEFTAYNSKMKYCNVSCSSNHSKELRKGTGNPAYRNGKYTKENLGKYHDRGDFCKIARKMKDDMIQRQDFISCEHCDTSNSPRFECHHLVYQSEKPKHKELHNERNLLITCIKCHNQFHKSKHKMREKYIKERNLTELFGNDILSIVL